METLTETTIEQTERLLIYQNDIEISRITSEGQIRAGLLNHLNKAGVTNDEIKTVTQSMSAIEDYILKRHLSVNKEFRKLHNAGIKAEAVLPEPLVTLKYNLTAWFKYPTQRHGGNKFENLIYTDAWKVDDIALENLFVRTNLKVYISGEKLSEYREIEFLCKYFEKNKMSSNQIHDSSFLWSRIEPAGSGTYRPRTNWFRER